MTVFDNVMFPLNMFSNDILRDRIKRAMFCLDRVNLGKRKISFREKSVVVCRSVWLLRVRLP